MATPPKVGGTNYYNLNSDALTSLKEARTRIRDLIRNVKQESDRRRAMRQWDANDLIELSLTLSDISDAIEGLLAQQEIMKEDRKLGNVIEADFKQRRVAGDE